MGTLRELKKLYEFVKIPNPVSLYVDLYNALNGPIWSETILIPQ